MGFLLQRVRDRFHLLHYARKSRMGRLLIRAADRPAWIDLPSVRFRVRGLRMSHGLSYGFMGVAERNPRKLALTCLDQFKFRSFWDVGANFGYYSWLLKSVDPGLKTVLVEPVPKNAALIRVTIERNGFADAFLVEAGASKQQGEGVLNVDALVGSTSSLIDQETFEQRHYGTTPTQIRISLVSLDWIREQHGPAEFVKIDVEGHEEATLQGATEVISKDRPVFFIECMHPAHSCLNILESAGYAIIDADKLSADCSEQSSNFFCIPPEKKHLCKALLSLATMDT
jgi:FkbM family methyltransferase